MSEQLRAAALEELRRLDDKHFPTTREKRPEWQVCSFDSMTWPCDTQKALDAFEPWYAVVRPTEPILTPELMAEIGSYLADEPIEVRRIALKDGKLMLVVGPFSALPVNMALAEPVESE